MQLFALSVALFVCAFVQVTSGFGFALIAMPLTVLLLGLDQAAPLVAIAGLLVNIVNMLWLRRHVNWSELLRVGAMGLLGVPLGFWLQAHVAAGVVRVTLGCLIVGYAVYAILQPRGLSLRQAGWAFPAGLAAGTLGAAYNIPGPPLIVYGTLRGWPREEFRSTLQTFFALNGVVVAAGHVLLGHLDRPTGLLLLLTLPALAAGNVAGLLIDRHINAARFQQIVKWLILLTGLALIV